MYYFFRFCHFCATPNINNFELEFGTLVEHDIIYIYFFCIFFGTYFEF
jgi:hypothetical protein